MTDVCRCCGSTLNETNWYASFQKAKNRLCKPCANMRVSGPLRDYRARLRQADLDGCREVDRARAQSWRDRNPERSREASRQYRDRHPEKVKHLRQDWVARNPAKASEYAGRRRAAKQKSPTLTPEECAKIAEMYELAALLTNVVGVPYHVDHIVAYANGGVHHPDNLVVMRGDYNQRKHALRWFWLERMFGAAD
jgi:hypothetical protein